MSFLPQNSRHFTELDELARKKISELVTRFHSVLLPKACDSGVFRDLSEQEDYLLSNLDSEPENSLHSILAGCLAIDSCLSNMFQAQRNISESILRSLTLVITTFASIRPKENQPDFTLLADNLLYLAQQIHQLPYCESSGEHPRQLRLLKELKAEDPLISSLSLFDEPSQPGRYHEDKADQKKIKTRTEQLDESEEIRCSPTFNRAHEWDDRKIAPTKERNALLSELFQAKGKLQKELGATQAKLIELELENERLRVATGAPEEKPSKGSQKLLYIHQNQGVPETAIKKKEVFESLLQPFSQRGPPERSSLRALEELIRELRDDNDELENEKKALQKKLHFYIETNQGLKESYEQEKNSLKNIIRKLEDRLYGPSGYEGVDVWELLNELEEEIDVLRIERREDKRLLVQLRSKVMNLRRHHDYLHEDYAEEAEFGMRWPRTKDIRTEHMMERSRSRSNISRVSNRGNLQKMRETMGSMANRERHQPMRRSTIYSSHPEELYEFDDARSQYSVAISGISRPTTRGFQRAESPQFRPIDENRGQQTLRVLRASRTEQNLHKKQPSRIPVIETIPYADAKNEKVLYNDSFMADTHGNTPTISSIKNRREPEKEHVSIAQNKISKLMGFKGSRHGEGPVSGNAGHFDNPFQTAQECLEGQELAQKQGRDGAMLMIPQVEPLALKNMSKLNANPLQSSGGQNERYPARRQ